MTKIAAPERPWVHIVDAQHEIADLVGALARRYNAPQELRISLRWPTEADGCWCYARSPRPHPHLHELGGCPVHSAGDHYVELVVSQGQNSQPTPE